MMPFDNPAAYGQAGLTSLVQRGNQQRQMGGRGIVAPQTIGGLGQPATLAPQPVGTPQAVQQAPQGPVGQPVAQPQPLNQQAMTAQIRNILRTRYGVQV